MNPVVIILGVLLVVITYLIFFVFTGTQSLNKKVDLGGAQSPILASTLSNPGSVRYSYELWVYVYQFETGGKYLFYRTSKSGNKNIGLKLGNTEPSLNLEYTTTAATAATATSPATTGTQKSLVISSNFPIQTWTQVIISVDNNYIDAYINGKLVKSIQDSLEAPDINSSITYGVVKAYLAKFNRNTYPIDPQAAWNNYMAGNGVSGATSSLMGNYGASITFNKDAAEFSKLTLF
jgi:hypothetical protein